LKSGTIKCFVWQNSRGRDNKGIKIAEWLRRQKGGMANVKKKKIVLENHARNGDEGQNRMGPKTEDIERKQFRLS